MDEARLRALLESVAGGRSDVSSAIEALRSLPFSDIDDATVDHHRELRCGFPEVIFCQGKTPAQVRSIGRELLDHGDVLLATRADASHYQALAQVASDARYFEAARVIVVDRRAEPPAGGHIVIATGGTADLPVAEEAAVCAEVMGNRVTRLFDVGVAGVHRLLARQELLRSAHVIIAVAGMEGALPSVITGLVACPVVAVPTSVGYGTNFGGISALLTMLNSCASGLTVVNIDNGFGAAAAATRINRPVSENSTDVARPAATDTSDPDGPGGRP
ncbi:MAG: 1-(5-phosphoribosyl)-5-amino-4-imidazole-carboxylate carboxylase [Actinobacteria bacterium HGW-Actinobacteria-10]|nr:MAG: 1-(5-phosphoribosyl)-5-amino-4-imidazole-carboxylate carboxylase [Actinobacteria bacterium HGW-Actinobacteria-10]